MVKVAQTMEVSEEVELCVANALTIASVLNYDSNSKTSKPSKNANRRTT